MKNTITTLTLAMTLAFGATFANAGILVSDGPATGSCDSSSNGIIIEGLITGIIIEAAGIIIETSGTPCTTSDGIIIE